MRSVWFLALATLGCRSVLGIDPPNILTDASGDAAACATWHPLGFDPCAYAPVPLPRLEAGSYIYDTTTAGGTLFDGTGHAIVSSKLTLTQPDQSVVAVLSIDALAVDAGATISVIGPKPLLVVAGSTITVEGVIDAGSYVGVTDVVKHTAQTVRFGAGANQACASNVGGDGASAASIAGSMGGGGGGFQGVGGAGARGAGASPPGGAGGAMVPAQVIRAGCPGGASGTAGPGARMPASASSQALGGAGGGAIRLVARDSIMVMGSISANGAGGAGAPQSSSCGGGGGGSGGYVALEAPTVTIGAMATVTANGGGGGGGGGDDAGNEGADGKIDLLVAPGGAISRNGCGQAGGAGSLAAQLDGANAMNGGGCLAGGGGGGGAAGYLLIASPGFVAEATAKLSPAPLF